MQGHLVPDLWYARMTTFVARLLPNFNQFVHYNNEAMALQRPEAIMLAKDANIQQLPTRLSSLTSLLHQAVKLKLTYIIPRRHLLFLRIKFHNYVLYSLSLQRINVFHAPSHS